MKCALAKMIAYPDIVHHLDCFLVINHVVAGHLLLVLLSCLIWVFANISGARTDLFRNWDLVVRQKIDFFTSNFFPCFGKASKLMLSGGFWGLF